MVLTEPTIKTIMTDTGRMDTYIHKETELFSKMIKTAKLCKPLRSQFKNQTDPYSKI